mmetsp:Transcript_92765/g.198894  ORF Transcript_92765/g.198894 Transcript_92765/m.198894 type:complete len:231 (-) Transcript_92765:1137-1829(-)
MVHHIAMPLQRPREVISNLRFRRTSSRTISGDRSKSKPQSVFGGPNTPICVLSWLSMRTAHHQKSAFSFDVVWRKALKGRMSNSFNLSERISTGAAESSIVFGMCETSAFVARAWTALCINTEAGTMPFDSMSWARSSVRMTTCFASLGTCCATAFAMGASLSKPSGTATIAKLVRLFALRIFSPTLASLVDISIRTPFPFRATVSMGRMDPKPSTTKKAPFGTAAMASL